MHALRISTDTADIDMDVVHGYLSCPHACL